MSRHGGCPRPHFSKHLLLLLLRQRGKWTLSKRVKKYLNHGSNMTNLVLAECAVACPPTISRVNMSKPIENVVREGTSSKKNRKKNFFCFADFFADANVLSVNHNFEAIANLNVASVRPGASGSKLSANCVEIGHATKKFKFSHTSVTFCIRGTANTRGLC